MSEMSPQSKSIFVSGRAQANIWGGLAGFLLIILILGGVLEWISVYFGYKRYYLSVELLLAFFISALGYFWIGCIVFMVALAWEVVLGAASILYLFDYSQILTIVGFLFQAKPAFLVASFTFLVVAFAMYFFAKRLVRQIGWARVLVVSILILLTQAVASLKEGNFTLPNLADRKNLVAGSSIYFSELVIGENSKVFNLRSHDNVEYIPIPSPSAMQQTVAIDFDKKSYPKKILYIIAESWGMPKSNQILNEQVASITANGNIVNLEMGLVHARGATAFAEFRELCGKVPTKLNLKKISTSDLGECWPSKFKELGYKTISVHGAHGTMYDRLNWYPVLGLDEMVFKDVLPKAPSGECHSFPGYCDEDLFPVVQDRLKSGEKVFLYWLTLSTHMPYDARDIKNYQKNLCDSVFSAGYDDNFCNYQNLQVQFFESLSRLANDKSLSGVKVVIVGDHPPPLLLDSSKFKYFEDDRVPFMSFDIK